MLQISKSEFVEVMIDDNVSRGIGHNGVEVVIDRKKCNYSMYDPTGCKGVFCTRPIEKRDFLIPPKDRIDPTIWIILATWADWCNGCGACVKECPKGAISIQFGEKALLPKNFRNIAQNHL
jgi:ferredoxin